MNIKRILLFLCFLLLIVTSCGGNKKCWLDDYPVEVPYSILNDLIHWNILSITCIGYNETGYSNSYKFLIKGVGKKPLHSNHTNSRYVDFYCKCVGTKDVVAAGTYIFPFVEQGESFELEISALHTEYFDPGNFLGFAISYRH